jgi:hypothetical protein
MAPLGREYFSIANPFKQSQLSLRKQEGNMKLLVASAAAIAAALIGSGIARADDALQTLEGMHMTPPIDWPTIPQGGPKADGIRQILKDKIKLPPGFHIDLYALVPDARHMAVGPQGS